MITKHSFADINNESLAEECYDLVKRFSVKQEVISNVGGIQLHKIQGYTDSQSVLFNLEQRLLKLVPEAVDIQLWININFPGCYNKMHTHDEIPGMSGTYYVQVDEFAGDFVYTHDEITHQVTPEPGQVLLFSSMMLHGVEPNLSSADRISISFNYVSEKRVIRY
tara:strand:+ start:1159 stop:1653 length:495 start_codon:yes stop_codon:yes gene_type:complete